MIFTFLFILFLIWLQYKIKKSNRNTRHISDSFWEKEYQSNQVRRKNIDHLDYIKIPLSSLPFKDTKDQKLLSYQQTMKQLSTQKILNLSGISNTDLKLMYGVANLEFLSECDAAFITLCRTIVLWGKYLHELALDEEAAKLLEFGISIGSDISQNYILLGTLYANSNKMQQLNELIETAKQLNSIMTPSIIGNLNDILLNIPDDHIETKFGQSDEQLLP